MHLTAVIRSADRDLVRDALRHGPTLAAVILVELAVLVSHRGEAVLPALVLMGMVGPVLARIDIVERRLPFSLSVPCFAGILLLLLLAGDFLAGEAPVARAGASAAGWLAFYGAIYAVTRGRGLGLGDVVLAPTLGLVLGWIGWGASIVGLGAGFGMAALAAVPLVAVGRGCRASLPFGPFMLAGALLGAVAGLTIGVTYLGGGR